MREAALVQRIIQFGFPQEIKTKNKISHATEVRAIKNKADLVYFEHNDNTIGSIFAIEAKLYNWRKALKQAYRNKLFADRAYVALPEESAAPAICQIQEFHHASVGLIIVSNTYSRVYYNPPLNTYRSPKHVEKVQQTLSCLVG
jgi:DNA-binding helix-hairpin-helix protein with protein kinase domain